jgi:hypothetical protein
MSLARRKECVQVNIVLIVVAMDGSNGGETPMLS